MSDEIVNRVANSGLVNFDLEAYYPKGQRQLIDLKDWLFEGLILKENKSNLPWQHCMIFIKKD